MCLQRNFRKSRKKKRKKMANNNHLFSAPCYNGTMLTKDYYNNFFDIGQQKINFSFYELVRKVIEENRRRKLTKHKKISNNTLIEIDHCSPLEILKLQKNLVEIAKGEGRHLRYMNVRTAAAVSTKRSVFINMMPKRNRIEARS